MKPVAYHRESDKTLHYAPLFDDEALIDYHSMTPLYAIDFTKYKVVPIEATDDIANAGVGNDTYKGIYRDMIEAAPDIEDL